MFTGLVEAAVSVLAFEARATGARLVLAAPAGVADWEVERGDSVAVSGCCLTVVEPEAGPELRFDLSSETLARTWLERLRPGVDVVNLERAMRLSDRVGGHLVAGHVDGVGRLVASHDPGDGGRVLRFEVPAGLERYLIEKGSIALDGVSLTVVGPVGREFDVALIPETLARTSLGRAKVGDPVHVEADLIGKWIERLALPSRAR